MDAWTASGMNSESCIEANSKRLDVSGASP